MMDGKIRRVNLPHHDSAGGERGAEQTQQHDRPPAGRPPRQHARSGQNRSGRRPDERGRPFPADLAGQKDYRQQNEERLSKQGVESDAGRGQDEMQVPGRTLGHGRGADGRGAVTPAAGRHAGDGESLPPAPA